MDIYDDPKPDFAIERKADNSPLTIADKRANARIMKELEAATLPALSEERGRGDETRKEWKTLWKILLQTGA